jgi:hypothetical protein
MPRRMSGSSGGGMATATSKPQHLQALDRANVVRLARSEHRARLKVEGVPAALEMIEHPPEHMRTCTLALFLTSLPQIGYSRMRRIVAYVPISEKRTLGSLTPHSRQRLTEALRDVLPSAVPRVPYMVENALLREHCERRVERGESWSQLAEFCGAYKRPGRGGDTQWLKKMLGLVRAEGKVRDRISMPVAMRIMDGLGVDPVDVGL